MKKKREKLKNKTSKKQTILRGKIVASGFLLPLHPTLASEVFYQVQKGDSLWDIGLKYDSNDIENFLFEAKKLNNLDNSTIFEDQILIIP